MFIPSARADAEHIQIYRRKGVAVIYRGYGRRPAAWAALLAGDEVPTRPRGFAFVTM